jgi:hypothetical protein
MYISILCIDTAICCSNIYIHSSILKWCVSAGHLLVSIHKRRCHLSFLCASTASFILYSSLCLVHISHTFFSIQTFHIAIHATSLLFSITNSSMIRSAYIFATSFVASILAGSSISQLISILQSNVRCKYLIFGIGLTITGRVISHMKTRQMSGLDALCVSSFSNTILDCGYISFISSVGLVGLKVSIIQ